MIRFDSFQIKWIGLKFPGNFAQINFMPSSRRALGFRPFSWENLSHNEKVCYVVSIFQKFTLSLATPPTPRSQSAHDCAKKKNMKRENICFRTFQEPIMRVSPDEIHAQQRKEFAERLLVIGRTRQDDERREGPRKIK